MRSAGFSSGGRGPTASSFGRRPVIPNRPIVNLTPYHTRLLGQVLCLSCLLLAGCIRDKRSGCLPEPEERFVVLKIVDEATGRDITETGDAGDAELYLFSPDGAYAARFSVDNDRIVHHTPVHLSGGLSGNCTVSVWANAGAGQMLHVPADGNRLENRAVSLLSEEGGYRSSPDDLFFGRIRLAPVAGPSPEEVTLTRKNARMHITVRGLDATVPADRYYLTVRIPSDGYDFAGNPAASAAVLRRPGEFDSYGDFSTPGTFNLIHTGPSGASAGEVTVDVYEQAAGRAADRLIASAKDDGNGKPIALPAGRTVNLLIDLGAGAGITVRTEITPWNEIYQWESW